MPAAEVVVDEDLVRALLSEQHPDLAQLDVRIVGEGWDNVTLRLGDDLGVRVPRRAMAAPLILNEQRWLPVLAPRLPLAVPTPVRNGQPGCGFPWAWSVCPWLTGEIATGPLRSSADAALTLGEFVAALAVPAPADAPPNPYRGVPLPERHDVTVARIAQLTEIVDGPRLRELWDDLCATPLWDGPPVWLHGDLHPANLLATNGELTAVIDFGDITGGDPATDLAGGWMLFEGEDLAAFRRAAGDCDDDTWRRARGWALVHSLACLGSSADNDTMAAIGHRTLAAVLAAG